MKKPIAFTACIWFQGLTALKYLIASNSYHSNIKYRQALFVIICETGTILEYNASYIRR